MEFQNTHRNVQPGLYNSDRLNEHPIPRQIEECSEYNDDSFEMNFTNSEDSEASSEGEDIALDIASQILATSASTSASVNTNVIPELLFVSSPNVSANSQDESRDELKV